MESLLKASDTIFYHTLFKIDPGHIEEDILVIFHDFKRLLIIANGLIIVTVLSQADAKLVELLAMFDGERFADPQQGIKNTPELIELLGFGVDFTKTIVSINILTVNRSFSKR